MRPNLIWLAPTLALAAVLAVPACLDAAEPGSDDAMASADALVAGDHDALAAGLHAAPLSAPSELALRSSAAAPGARDDRAATVVIGQATGPRAVTRWLPEVVAHAVLAPPTQDALAAAATRGEPDPDEPVAEGWFGLLHAGDLVLAQEAPPAWWGGPAAFIARGGDGVWALERGAHEEALPHALRAWLGREVRLYGVAGEVCLARVDGFALRSEFTDYGSWDDELGAARDRAEQTPDEAWEDGGQLLLGTLTTTRGDCEGARVAVDARHRPLTVLAPAPVDAALEARALAAFRALPEWRELQATFVEDLPSFNHPAAVEGAPGLWDRFDGVRTAVTRFRDAVSGRERVQVVGDTEEGCGGPSGRLVAVFEAAGGALEPVAAVPWAPRLEGFIDVDGDGVLEGALSRNAVVGATFDGEPRAEVVIPDHSSMGCGC